MIFQRCSLLSILLCVQFNSSFCRSDVSLTSESLGLHPWLYSFKQEFWWSKEQKKCMDHNFSESSGTLGGRYIDFVVEELEFLLKIWIMLHDGSEDPWRK
ncbi:hypothetical protein DCAR_0729926 [Daucus carota subsp. sativus]|uniref:Uncharacterized protein n=1 Tax=Daucus carota subsp. sativus TaxID=79200 RepID=A0AAF0XNR6_DAUCS|nr:hypothetical protein DCAR_0729926 [Daucus carota subsp. sativus]